MDNTDSSRSWFCVLNNPQNLFGDIDPREMVDKAIELWILDKPHRTCAINYEIGDSGTPHMHMVLEDPAKARFSAIQKIFTGIHIEKTKGSKEQAEDYINKRGKFTEKNHTVIVPAVYHGEIKANKGSRNDLEIIEQLIEQGKTPNEIMDMSFAYSKYEKMIKGAFWRKKRKELALNREVSVVWHVGEAGSGKSYTYVELCEQFGKENIYLLTDYEIGGFDNYCAEPILFMDEFKGNIKFQCLLNYLDHYPIQIHCRYANCYAIWNTVHITSVFPPEEAYNFMVDESNRNKDKINQLMRRIHSIVYHYKEDNQYKQYELPASEYSNYQNLKQRVSGDGFSAIQMKDCPFQD